MERTRKIRWFGKMRTDLNDQIHIQVNTKSTTHASQFFHRTPSMSLIVPDKPHPKLFPFSFSGMAWSPRIWFWSRCAKGIRKGQRSITQNLQERTVKCYWSQIQILQVQLTNPAYSLKLLRFLASITIYDPPWIIPVNKAVRSKWAVE